MSIHFPFPAVERPKLRRGIVCNPLDSPFVYAVGDARSLVPGGVRMPATFRPLLGLADGTHTQAEMADATNLPAEKVAGFFTAMDRALLLEGPAFEAYLASPQRLPSCIGVYPEAADEIPAVLAPLFPDGIPDHDPAAPPLRALLVPHMDYERGNVTYGLGFAEVARRSQAEVFVIVATSHYSGELFTLTRKDYWTPLGTAPTDQASIDLLEKHYGEGLFDDPYAHLPEHSIELEVLLLQYVRNGKPFTVVPLLVGSFDACVARSAYPMTHPDIVRMVDALKALDAELGDRACWIISGDLAHIGPKFRDPEPVNPTQLAHSRMQDEHLLDAVKATDPAAYFTVIHDEEDARRICGFPPTWLTLTALQPSAGTLHHYQQYVHPEGHESVSFAAASFVR